VSLVKRSREKNTLYFWSGAGDGPTGDVFVERVRAKEGLPLSDLQGGESNERTKEKGRTARPS